MLQPAHTYHPHPTAHLLLLLLQIVDALRSDSVHPQLRRQRCCRFGWAGRLLLLLLHRRLLVHWRPERMHVGRHWLAGRRSHAVWLLRRHVGDGRQGHRHQQVAHEAKRHYADLQQVLVGC